MNKQIKTVVSKFYKKLLRMTNVFFRMTGMKIADFLHIVKKTCQEWNRLQKNTYQIK